MRPLSFGTQSIACFAAVLAGHYTASALDYPILVNAAVALSGIVFIVHPVLPAWATWGNRKTMLDAVRVGGTIAVALALLTRFDI